MASLSNPKQLQNITDVQEFMRYCAQAVDDIQTVVNGQIEYGQNIKSQTVSVLFNQANADVMIRHTLNKIGVNFSVVNKNMSSDFYHGSGVDTLGTIYLRSTVAGVTATIILF